MSKECRYCVDCDSFNGSQYCGHDGRFTTPGNPACEHFTSSFEKKISTIHTERGWVISCGNKSVEVGQRLEDLEKVIDAEVAPKLGVEPKELQAVRLGILAKCTEPKEGIRVENVFITVDFDKTIKLVHPAIDIVDGIEYVGVWLPCTLAIEPRKVGEPAKVEEEDLHFLITNQREKILVNSKILREKELKLAHQPIAMSNRWSLKSVQNFLSQNISSDPAEVYDIIKKQWQSYIELDDSRVYDLLTLWTIGTYFCYLFSSYPYIYIGGVKRCGKTKTLTVASLLTFNAVFTANMSAASIFRLIQSGRCTILMDETEGLTNPERKQEFRSILLSGYKHGGIVYRVEKDRKEKLTTQPFEVYSAKMICNIQGLEDVLEDRCIPIIMKRGKDKAILNKEINFDDPVWQEMRDKLYIFFLTRRQEIKKLYDTCESCDTSEPTEQKGPIKSRDWELWRPIFALAKFFSPFVIQEGSQDSEASQDSLFVRIKQLATEFSRQREIENMTETRDCLLVRALLELVIKDSWYPTRSVREALEKQFDEPQTWLSNDWVGRALKRLKFFEKRHVGQGNEWFLKCAVVEDLAERMGVEKQAQKDEAQTVLEPNEKTDKCEFCDRQGNLHLIPSRGTVYLCSEHEREWEGKL